MAFPKSEEPEVSFDELWKTHHFNIEGNPVEVVTEHPVVVASREFADAEKALTKANLRRSQAVIELEKSDADVDNCTGLLKDRKAKLSELLA